MEAEDYCPLDHWEDYIALCAYHPPMIAIDEPTENCFHDDEIFCT